MEMKPSVVLTAITFIAYITSICLCEQTDVVFFGITTSTAISSDENASINLTISWNKQQYKCIINGNGSQIITPNTYYGCITVLNATYIGPLTTNTYDMKIEIGNNTDLVLIESISVKDKDSVLYKIDEFCRLSSSNTVLGESVISGCCLWSSLQYKYNHLVMGSNQVFSADIKFRSNILSYSGIGTEGCIKPPTGNGSFCSESYSSSIPNGASIVFTDNLNDAVSTGWIFSGDYDATITALNCPNGINDKCARLTHGSMTMRIPNMSKYNYIEPIYKSYTENANSCYFQYSSDGTSYQTLSNSLKYIPNTYNTLYIRFLKSSDTDYCYYDDVRIWAENMENAIDYDIDSRNLNKWSLTQGSTNKWVTSNYCPIPGSYCFELQRTYAAYRTYSNIKQYTNLQLSLDIKGPINYSSLYIYYSFDGITFKAIHSFRITSSSLYKQRFAISPLNICGSGDNLIIEFYHSTPHHEYVYFSNIALYGDLIPTVMHTTPPTLTPQTLFPTITPIVSPTMFPSSYPTVPTTPRTTTLVPTRLITSLPTTSSILTLLPTASSKYTPSPTSISTKLPTATQTKIVESTSSNPTITAITTNKSQQQISKQESNNIDITIWIIIILLAVIVLIIVIVTVVYFKKFRKREKNISHVRLEEDDENLEGVQNDGVSNKTANINTNSTEMTTMNISTDNHGTNILLQDAQ